MSVMPGPVSSSNYAAIKRDMDSGHTDALRFTTFSRFKMRYTSLCVQVSAAHQSHPCLAPERRS